MFTTVCRAAQLHSHMLCGRAARGNKHLNRQRYGFSKGSFGVHVYVSFMEQTTTKEAALQIHFTPFARDKELNIAAAEPVIDDARPLWLAHDG